MHLVQSPLSPAPRTLLPLARPAMTKAANDSVPRARHMTRQVNTLVASVVGQVAARVQPRDVNIQLRLASGNPTVWGEPTELAFVVGAVLGAALRSVEEGNGEYVGVAVAAERNSIRILITTDEVPPLRFVRALESDGRGSDVDPTLAHCRRLIEARGGALVLTEQAGRLGFAVELPRASLSPCLGVGESQVALAA